MHRKHRAKWRQLLAALLALAMIAAACSSGDSDDSSDGDTDGDGAVTSTTADIATATTAAAPDETGLEIQRGGELTIGIVAESTGWYPPSAETAFSAGFLVMDALYDRWFDQTSTGEIIPVLAAARAEPNIDATQWTMQIREGIDFHDGTPLNAQAAVDMITQWHEGPFGASSTIESAEVVDEFTVRYILKDPDPAFEGVLSGISTGAAFSPTAGLAFGPEGSVENPVGTGPFMFESWTRDSEMVVVRNPNYWRDAPDGEAMPYLDRIRFRVLPDGNSRRAALEAGDLDMATQGGPDGGPQLVEAGFVPYESIGNGAGLNIYNVFSPPMDDVRIRRAAAHALNPDAANEIGPSNLAGVNVPRSQYFTTESVWFSPEADEAYAWYDPDEAARLVDEYVNDPNRSDGKAVGEPVSFRYFCNTEPLNRDTALLYQQEWGDVGMDVELEFMEQSTLITTVVGTTSDPLYAGDFDVSCWADGNENDPLTLFRARYGVDQVLNWTNYTSPEIDEQIDILRNNLDFETRYAAAAEISRITAEEMTVHWWSSGSTLVLARPEVKGVETYTYPDGEVGERRGSGRVWWHEVWLEDGTPATDLPTDFIEIPAITTTTTTEAPAEEALPVNDAVLAAMPAPVGILTLGDTEPPLPLLCEGIVTLDGITPISATTQNYNGAPQVGPFGAVTVWELEPGDADTVFARYEQALAECSSYTSVLDGTPLNLGYSERDLGSWGDRSLVLGNSGDAGGFPIDIDTIVMQVGDNVALVTSLHVLAAADGSVSVPLADGALEILNNL